MAKEKIGNTELFYKKIGFGKEILIFINGIAMTSDNWKEQMSFFSTKYTCIFYDLRGQLLSDPLNDNFKIEIHIEDLKNLLNHLKIKSPNLIGIGLGAEIALLYSTKYPDDAKTITSIAGFAKSDDRINSIMDSWINASKADPKIFLDVTIPWNYSKTYLSKNKELIKLLYKFINNIPLDYYENFAKLSASLKNFNIMDRLYNIKCPCLIISGEKDLIVKTEQAKELHDKIKIARLAIVKGSGHALIFEKPEIVNKLIDDFLKENIK